MIYKVPQTLTHHDAVKAQHTGSIARYRIVSYKNALHSTYCLPLVALTGGQKRNDGTTGGLMWPSGAGGPICPIFRPISSQVMSTTRTLGKSSKVLEVRVISMHSFRRDAFLSELLRHSHQVSGVWVAKTARPAPY